MSVFQRPFRSPSPRESGPKQNNPSVAALFPGSRVSYSKLVSLSLSILLLGQGLSLPASAAPGTAGSKVITGDVRLTVSPENIRQTLPIPGAARRITMALHGVSVQDALRALARKGGFNVLIDESVTGDVSVDWNNVTIQDALENLKTYSNLAYDVKSNNLTVAAADSDKGRTFQKSRTRIIHLRNANAKIIADLINSTVFADRLGAGSGSGSASGSSAGSMPVTADFHTNSLIVVGSPTDIKVVEEHAEALDKPRASKTWRLSQSNVLDVASILSSSLFNEGQPALIVSGGGGSSSASGSGIPSTMRVTAEKVQDGQNTSQASQSGGGSSGQSASVVNNITLRARVKETQTVQINPNGPILIPDTRLNTLTLLGTAEQIAMAEAMIPTLDRKVPQVILEASLVELSEIARKELGYSSASNRDFFSSGSNNNPTATTTANAIWSNTIGRTANNAFPLESVFRFVTSPRTRQSNFAMQITALVQKNKARMLANPTVVTSSDSETVVSIVDEIIRSVTVTQGFGLPPSATTNIGEAGIVLNLLPRVGADQTVSLRVRPVVSTVAGQQTDRFGNVVTLLSKREVLAQNVVMHDGETFILGGLIHNTDASVIARNPWLSRLPIVGALGRNASNNKNRTELLVMITPHIINDEAQVARTQSVPGSQLVPATLTGAKPPESEPGMVPVSFTGAAGPVKRSVLPPMEKARIIGNTSAISPTPAAGALPANHPTMTGSLQPSELMAAPATLVKPSPEVKPQEVVVERPVVSVPAKTKSKWMESSPITTTAPRNDTSGNKPVIIAPDDVSDEAIRAIMNKFK